MVRPKKATVDSSDQFQVDMPTPGSGSESDLANANTSRPVAAAGATAPEAARTADRGCSGVTAVLAGSEPVGRLWTAPAATAITQGLVESWLEPGAGRVPLGAS